jgi:hypothetical protein
MLNFGNFKTLAAAAAVVMSAGVAQAATVGCTPEIAGKVTVNIGCEVSLTADQDFLNLGAPHFLTVNEENFFGTVDWSFIGKHDFDGGAAEGTAPVIGLGSNAQVGTFSIDAGLWDLFGEVMAIFKSGNETFLTGYLLNTGDTEFDYASMFLQFDKDGKPKDPKDISHISLYGRGDPSPVPVPAAGLLLIGALGGLAALRRRKTA